MAVSPFPTCPPDALCFASGECHWCLVPMRVHVPGGQPGVWCTREGDFTFWGCPPGHDAGCSQVF